MTPDQVDAYLTRIGLDRTPPADLETLRTLQERHLLAVPFENLSIHLGESIDLDTDALFAKIVERRRGGFCYELNGVFAALLAALGYRVSLLAARVQGKSGLGPPFDHLALRVDLDEPWLVDVGFGAFSTHPLRLDARDEQSDPGGTFQVVPADSGDLDILCNGELQYRLETRPRDLSNFEPTCWYHQTSPTSHFTWSPVCSLPVDGGRVTLSDRTLIETHNGERRQRALRTDAEILDAYMVHFGIEIERLPQALHPKDP